MTSAEPLSEEIVAREIRPLFSRVLQRDEIYLANHSLGRPLDQTADDFNEFLSHWYSGMDKSWSDETWMGEAKRFRSNVAKLIGAGDHNWVIPKTSAGQGMRAVLNALTQQPVRVVATTGEFDSIDFILKTYAARGLVDVHWVKPDVESPIPLFKERSIVDAISNGTDLVVVSKIVFATGQVLNMTPIIEAARAVGALVLVDVYHAAGVMPLSMEQMGADFMIGGSYKYTRGGPGACWLAVHPRHFGLETLDTGWFAKRDPFWYERPEDPIRAEGGDGWMESTPPVAMYYQARAGLEFTLRVGVDRLREYSLRQLAMLRNHFIAEGVPVYVPTDPARFGAFALLPSSSAQELSSKLKMEGVNTDARGGCVRFGPDVLTTEAELAEAARRTGEVLRT